MQMRHALLTIIGGVAAVIALSYTLLPATHPGGSRQSGANPEEADSSAMETRSAATADERVSYRSLQSVNSRQAAVVPKQRGKSESIDNSMSPDSEEVNPLRQASVQLRNRPADIEGMLEQLKTETDVERIKLLAQLISENAEAAGVDLPINDLLEMAASGNPIKRLAALRILSTSSRVTPEMIRTVAELSKTDAQKDVRFAAINTMGEWMERNANLREQLSADIIGARDASTSPDIRGYAIQTVGLQKNGLPPSMLQPMVHSMQSESVPEIRSLAALAVSHADANLRPQALQHLQQAYHSETDLDAKRHLLTMIMRTGGSEASAVLQGLPANDPLLRQDIADYVNIMARGVTDVNEIYDQKNQLDGKRGTEIDTDVNCAPVNQGQ